MAVYKEIYYLNKITAYKAAGKKKNPCGGVSFSQFLLFN